MAPLSSSLRPRRRSAGHLWAYVLLSLLSVAYWTASVDDNDVASALYRTGDILPVTATIAVPAESPTRTCGLTAPPICAGHAPTDASLRSHLLSGVDRRVWPVPVLFGENSTHVPVCSAFVSDKVAASLAAAVRADCGFTLRVAGVPLSARVGVSNDDNQTAIYSHYSLGLHTTRSGVLAHAVLKQSHLTPIVPGELALTLSVRFVQASPIDAMEPGTRAVAALVHPDYRSGVLMAAGACAGNALLFLAIAIALASRTGVKPPREAAAPRASPLLAGLAGAGTHVAAAALFAALHSGADVGVLLRLFGATGGFGGIAAGASLRALGGASAHGAAIAGATAAVVPSVLAIICAATSHALLPGPALGRAGVFHAFATASAAGAAPLSLLGFAVEALRGGVVVARPPGSAPASGWRRVPLAALLPAASLGLPARFAVAALWSHAQQLPRGAFVPVLLLVAAVAAASGAWVAVAPAHGPVGVPCFVTGVLAAGYAAGFATVCASGKPTWAATAAPAFYAAGAGVAAWAMALALGAAGMAGGAISRSRARRLYAGLDGR